MDLRVEGLGSRVLFWTCWVPSRQLFWVMGVTHRETTPRIYCAFNK